jgi:hypothetical protein
MEQFFQDNHTIPAAIRRSVPACARHADTRQPTSTSPPCPTATTYTLTATGKSSMTGFTYTINQANARQTIAAGTRPAGERTGHLLGDQQGRWLLNAHARLQPDRTDRRHGHSRHPDEPRHSPASATGCATPGCARRPSRCSTACSWPGRKPCGATPGPLLSRHHHRRHLRADTAGPNWVVSIDNPWPASARRRPPTPSPPRIIQSAAGRGWRGDDGGRGAVGGGFQWPRSPDPVPAATSRSTSRARAGEACVERRAGALPARPVSVGGQIRMCDPALPAGDAQAC